jgi:cytidylate kinase
MKHRILTISREFGSGGRTIGRHAAEKLGIPCYDSELIQRIAQESGFSEHYVRSADESAHSFPAAALGSRAFGPTMDDHLWQVQSHVILDLAERESCVIVGRCADYILRDTADCLTAFIHADPAFRAKRIVEVYGEREASPEQRIREKDKRRAAYHRFYTDMKWGHAKNYHICLDSGILGIDTCTDILCRLF